MAATQTKSSVIKTRLENVREKWNDLKNRPDIAKYMTDELLKKVKHCKEKTELYLSICANSSDRFPYLKYNLARLTGESILINIFPIVEILELNEKYLPRLAKLCKLEEVSNQPLLVWYIIGTYLKHSYKPYLPYDANLSLMDWKKKYEFIFDRYADDLLGINTMQNATLDSLSGDWKVVRRKAFQRVYYKWYDYLFVRLFGKAAEKKDIIYKYNNNQELNEEEMIRLDKWNSGRKAMVEDSLGFFNYLLESLIKDHDLPYQKTFVYKNKDNLWLLYKGEIKEGK